MKIKTLFNRLTIIFVMMLLVVIFFSCGESAQDKLNKFNFQNPNLIVIDSCEYLVIEVYQSSSVINRNITHKGNCKMCSQRRKNNCH